MAVSEQRHGPFHRSDLGYDEVRSFADVGNGLAARNRSDNRVLCTRPGADVEV